MSDEVRRCAGCGVEIAPGLLACPACRKLVHADRLKALAADAEIAEREGRLTEALTHWRAALDLLPREAKQHAVVSATVRRLSETLDRAGVPKPDQGSGGKVAGLGVAALAVWKLKFVILGILSKAKLLFSGLLSLPTLLTMLAFVAVDPAHGGYLAVGIVAAIYVHEMGHVAALRRYGIAATAPMFIPGLGALVRLRQYPIDAREDARVGLAGPVWGAAAGAFALALGIVLHNRTILAVASLSSLLNIFNLVPFWQLDGARGFRALDTRQRGMVIALAATAALVADVGLLWGVCAVGGVRLKSDLPAEGDRRAFWTFAALIVVLSLIIWAAGRASK